MYNHRNIGQQYFSTLVTSTELPINETNHIEIRFFFLQFLIHNFNFCVQLCVFGINLL